MSLGTGLQRAPGTTRNLSAACRHGGNVRLNAQCANHITRDEKREVLPTDHKFASNALSLFPARQKNSRL